jgi:hypothetical protein
MEKSDSMLSQNVWLKRLGLLLLICGLFPGLVITYGDEINWLGKTIIILIIITFAVKIVKDFIKSIWKS